MRISIQDDEEDKPGCLTDAFLTTLMTSETKKKGIFQILSFKRKRDLVYSTQISDGFHKTKSMVTNEAAKQIENGSIQ